MHNYPMTDDEKMTAISHAYALERAMNKGVPVSVFSIFGHRTNLTLNWKEAK